MSDALIENPILNSPFKEPGLHFKFTDEGITNEVVSGRRSSSYFIPIARPKKKGKQLAFDTEWTQDRIEENKTVNQIRQRVGIWREGGHVGVTPTTAALLKNHNLGFTIPYTINGEEHQYHPDFIVVMDDGRGPLDPLYLIVEVSGEKKKEKAAKVMTARTLWIPAVNNHGAFGRWGFLEVTDPYDVLELIRSVTSGTAV
jgi:hypothetical protein